VSSVKDDVVRSLSTMGTPGNVGASVCICSARVSGHR